MKTVSLKFTADNTNWVPTQPRIQTNHQQRQGQSTKCARNNWCAWTNWGKWSTNKEELWEKAVVLYF